jgi:hypothetical protein
MEHQKLWIRWRRISYNTNFFFLEKGYFGLCMLILLLINEVFIIKKLPVDAQPTTALAWNCHDVPSTTVLSEGGAGCIMFDVVGSIISSHPRGGICIPTSLRILSRKQVIPFYRNIRGGRVVPPKFFDASEYFFHCRLRVRIHTSVVHVQYIYNPTIFFNIVIRTKWNFKTYSCYSNMLRLRPI